MKAKEIIKNIQTIYDDHYVPLNVQRHMKEVAAVAEMICDNCKEKVDKESIVASCLIHDLGNIIKMDFEKKENIALLEKEDRKKIDFFKKKKEQFKEKYGGNAEKADLIIASEIGAGEKIAEMISHKAMHLKGEELEDSTLDEKIAAYADLRCSPKGIVSMKERLDEYYGRYNISANPEKAEHSKKFVVLVKQMEKELFLNISIKPEDITNVSAKKYIEKYGEVS